MFRVLFVGLVLISLVGCSTEQSARVGTSMTVIEDKACAVAPHARLAAGIAGRVVTTPSLVPVGTDQAKAELGVAYAKQGLDLLVALCAGRQGMDPASPPNAIVVPLVKP